MKDGFCEEVSDVVRRRNVFRVFCDDDFDYFFVVKDFFDFKCWF